MSASTSSNRAKARSVSGWTAFDLKQRRKQQSDYGSEAYPSLSALSSPQSLFNKDGVRLEKPFSSVVVASVDFPSLTTHVKNSNSQMQEPAATSFLGTTEVTEAYRKLNHLHPWADKSLIQDVLAGVNNNIDEALSLMGAMLICENKGVESNGGNDLASFDSQGSPTGEKECISFTDHESYIQSKDETSSIHLLDAAKSLHIISEPEWEEDDIYLIHRKDAIRMMRSASRFSKAAQDAYIRGDHAAARRFSLKAQQERSAAEKLNAKAAKEILDLQNRKNDLWTLDLHGLHAAEAVEALRERLQTVESLVSPNCLAAQNGAPKESGLLLAPSEQSTDRFEMEKVGGQWQPTSRPRTTLLQVITGNGNHSRGAAALPSSIRSFLNEKGYRFDETRPGVVMIRPKFRPW